MKKLGIIFLLILSLTACQPAKPQADSLSQDKAENTNQDVSDKSKTVEDIKNGEKEEISSTNDVHNLNTKIEDEATKEVQARDDFYRNYYEIFVASFYDSNGDKVGDLKGIEQKLDYIKGMGFTGIWLMPIHPSNTYHKYDVMDYYAIDKSYGNLQDMESLLATAKQKDIKIIIDLVTNHTADDHIWFQEAVNYLKSLPQGAEPNKADCKYIDYYYFTKDTTKGKSYHPIEGTDWLYEGVFWGEMPDLNVDNPEVRAEIEQIMRFWLDKGVAGFRLDAVKEFFSGYTQRNVDFLAWLYQTAKTIKSDVYMVGEAWTNFAEISEYYGSGLPSFFNFALATGEGKIAQVVNQKMAKHTAKSFAEAMVKIDESYAKKNLDYVDALFVANHDNVRMANYFKSDENKMKLAAGLYLTMTGASFTYYGEEIGMVSAGTKDENKRTAMHWSEEEVGQTLSPKDADSFEQTAKPVATQEADANSLLRYYQKALHLRQEIPALARGKVTVLEKYSNETIAVIEKKWENQTIRVVYNISAEPKTIDFAGENWQNQKILGYLSNEIHQKALWENAQLVLPPYGIAILGE